MDESAGINIFENLFESMSGLLQYSLICFMPFNVSSTTVDPSEVYVALEEIKIYRNPSDSSKNKVELISFFKDSLNSKEESFYIDNEATAFYRYDNNGRINFSVPYANEDVEATIKYSIDIKNLQYTSEYIEEDESYLDSGSCVDLKK